MEIKSFLDQMKAKCEAKAVEMAKLELSVWNNTHEQELKDNFGFTDKALAKRKKELSKKAKS